MNSLVRLALAVFLTLFASAALPQKTVVKVVGGNSDFALTPAEVTLYQGHALDGSANSAIKLADFYGMVKLDFDQELHWRQIAAENGSLAAMHDYWVVARLSSNPDEQRRGLFWLRKAASLGDKQSQAALKDSQVKN